MAYKIMKSLINGYIAGKSNYTKERLSDMCDVYYGAGKLTNEQYSEVSENIAELT